MHQHPIIKYYKSFGAAVVIILHLVPICAFAQTGNEEKKWTLGVSAGALNSSLQSNEAIIFLDAVNPFILSEEKPVNFSVSLRYYSNPTESIQLSLSNGMFSVLTDYQAWPEITFTNSFYQASLSYRLSLLRLLGVDPYPLDIYGSFGLGMILNNTKSEPTIGTPSERFSVSKDRSFSSVYTFGTGLSLQIGVIDVFTEYDFNISSSNIINELLISDVINTDFSNTTNKWSGLRFGFQYTLRKRTKAPIRNFQQPRPAPQPYVSTTAPALTNLEDLFTKVSRPVPKPVDPPEKLGITSILHQLNWNPSAGLIENARPVQHYGQFQEAPHEIPYQPEYGLMGTNTTHELPGFTIVLHSLSSKNAADTAASELRREGYMVFVIPIEVNNQTFYRVTMGQFETSTDALAAVRQLPAAYRDQNFLMAIP